MKKFGLWFYDSYQYIFDSSKNPLRHIPDPASRMFIMIILSLMWSGAFAIYLGSIFYFGISLAAHIVLILMVFFTVAIFYDAEKNQSSWLLKLRREQR
jgi:membrane protein YdbS with pleckstrin-like domain